MPQERTFTRSDVERIAALARLSVTDVEAERLAAELEAILAHVEQLSELDTAGVEPTTHVLGLVAALRPDEVGGVLPADLALGNAPQRAASALVVPQVKDE